MTITGVISALVFGLIIGALARLILPGKQNIPIWLTILVGIVGAFIGTFIARLFHAPTRGLNFIELILQIAVAVIGVAIVSRYYAQRGIKQ
ncbi:GlsB/YeaQ/YmgE family stress response membrane protein [Pseudonocardia acidicola]|uniref:GlsB/YeaQ/YmgE family stress response membrane protein n=1 Tax=Pseudonocardia acidicola TaxID=2724939 RepID=A0ABX1SNJ2_9PSEU|nr:GlsB/YeaQ/YmgE family stress response membrane protein [Pseudonocardia acidicola]NMI01987.1 GlsB/YeaQ/YmgE family stress response membrane protein [Pseudonocardia acidicola]